MTKQNAWSHLCKGLAFAVLLTAATAALAQESTSAHERGMATMGKHTYRSFCASCHGPQAKGDGSLAEMLTTPPSDLTQLAKENDGEFPFDRVVKIIDGREKVPGHGTAEMPAWGDAFQPISGSEEEVQNKIEQLAYFLKSIQEK